MTTFRTGELVEIDAELTVGGEPLTGSPSVSAVLLYPGARGAASTRVPCTWPGAAGVARATWPAAESATWTPGPRLVQFWTASGPYCFELPEIIIARGVPP